MQMDNMAKVSIQINIFILDYLTLEMFNTFSAVLGEGGHAKKLMTLSFEPGNRIFIRNKCCCFKINISVYIWPWEQIFLRLPLKNDFY